MKDPVFDFYKGFYKKASSWFMSTIIVLVTIAVIGIAYLAISGLKAKNENKNTNTQTVSEPQDGSTDTEMNQENANQLPGSSNDQDTGLNQDLFNDGSSTDLYGGSQINPNVNDGSTTTPQSDLGNLGL